MLVRLLADLAGAHGFWNSGDVAEFDDEDATRLIAAGYAEVLSPVRASASSGLDSALQELVETEVSEGAELATLLRRRRGSKAKGRQH